jgi:hypothetical protein
MPTLNYTTTIAAEKTIGEIQAMLARHGAAAIATSYEQGEAIGLSFKLDTPHGPRAFTLPIDVDAVGRLLIEQVRTGEIRRDVGRMKSREQAARVAWRVLKDWVEAQLAIIEAQMASLDQVMLPYLHVNGDVTMWELYRDNEQRAIEAAL